MKLVGLLNFFSSRRRHTRCLSDWSSDVCSSDLLPRRYQTKIRQMSDTRVGRASDLFGKVRCELHPKQARYQASLQPDSQEQRLDFSTRVSARGSTYFLEPLPEGARTPWRYQAATSPM